METKKPSFKTIDKWTKSPEEIFRKHGLTIKWGKKTGSCVFSAYKHLDSPIGLKDNNSKNETAISFSSKDFPTSRGTKE